MNRSKLKMYIFMALCCTMGLFVKKLVNPFANVITEGLHIPGGISTAFSTMFLVVAAELTGLKGGGSLMGLVQGMLALAMGRVGSMGALMPIGYLVPGVVMDISGFVLLKTKCTETERIAIINMTASCAAAFTANVLVFRLWGAVLVLYLAVAAISGLAFGLLGAELVKRLKKVIK